jgi:hypothetical protein
MNVHIIALFVMLILGIGIPNIFASDIASLNATGNTTVTPIPTPTLAPIPTPMISPNPSISVPLDLSDQNTTDGIIVNETIPTVQRLTSNNPNMSSIVVNFSTASDMEAEYDDEEQRLSIEITEGQPTEETAEEETGQEETVDVGDEEEGDNGDDNGNGNNEDNGDDNGNGNNEDNGDDNGNGGGNDNDNDDVPGMELPGLPDIDLPGGR